MIILYQNGDLRAVPLLLNCDRQAIPSYESAERLWQIATGLQKAGGCKIQEPDVTHSEILALLQTVHEPAYLDFLTYQSKTLDQKTLLIEHDFVAPGVSADTPIIAGMFNVALEGARTAVAAAHQLTHGVQRAYALCRPPGHHAGKAWMGGYCYLNNAVLALHTLIQHGFSPVGLIDIDYHFGNGSADILQSVSEAFFASLHCSTEKSFPYQKTVPLNQRQVIIPFEESPEPKAFLDALASVIEKFIIWGCTALVISIGFDIIDGDPHGGWNLPANIFASIGSLLAHVSIPLCFVQEGGYLLNQLETCAFHLGKGLQTN
jgi:acetoin utilization deacetylase AcuC-like enzyme